MNPNYGLLDVWYSGLSIKFEDHTAYQSRNQAMISLIGDAWRMSIAGRDPRDRAFRLYTDDIFNPYSHYSISSNSPENAWRCMPSFIFEKWPECGMHSYEDTFRDMVSAGDLTHEDDRAFWIGNMDAKVPHYLSRRMGAAVASRRPKLMDVRSVVWDSCLPSNFVSLPDHCRWRILLDFGGVGFSARVPLLLASGRPVILVGRPEESWFYWDGSLVPWKHYIPCGPKNGAGLSESMIENTVGWTFDNRELCDEIGRNGRAFALAHLTRMAAVARIAHMLCVHPVLENA